MPRIPKGALRRVQLLFEDDQLLVLNKPPGLAVHGGAGGRTSGRSLIEVVRAAYTEPVDVQLAHRLDRSTSGVLLLTKERRCHQRVVDRWDAVQKDYLAIVAGSYRGPPTLDAPLKQRDGPKKAARTEVELLGELKELSPQASLLSVRLGTGRMHQIRRHLADAGYPILMDDKHGDFAKNRAFVAAVRARGQKRPKELFLHAWRLRLPHPETGAALSFTAPPPPVWGSLLQLAQLDPALLA